jgi:hypothetical protein
VRRNIRTLILDDPVFGMAENDQIRNRLIFHDSRGRFLATRKNIHAAQGAQKLEH